MSPGALASWPPYRGQRWPAVTSSRTGAFRRRAPNQIRAYFEACFSPRNVLTSAIREIVTAHQRGQDDQGRALSLAHLTAALDEVPILSIRKYAYEHGLAFFWRELALPEAEFDSLCDVIAELVKTYKVVQFQATRLAATGNRELFATVFALLEQQDEREALIKRRLHEVFRQWCARSRPSSTGTTPAVTAGALS